MRVHSFLGTLNRDTSGKKVLAVVHGHWLILFQRLVQRFGIDESVRRYSKATAENASVIVFQGEKLGEISRLVLKEEGIIPWKGKLDTAAA